MIDPADAAAGPAAIRFSSDALGLRLTIDRAEMLFTSAAAGDFFDPTDEAAEAVESLSAVARDHWAQDQQIHGSHVNVIRAGEPVTPFTSPADGQASDRDDLLCAVRTADCLAVLVTSGRAVAAIHAGWRGLSGGVIAAGVAALRELDSGPLSAAIGPGARGCCYEVGDQIRETFSDYPAAAEKPGTLDLAVVAAAQLEALGVGSIYDCGICTICSEPEEFFSHRRDDGETGRMLGAVWLS